MTDERYSQLMGNLDLSVTPEEFDEGYHFCMDWDGLLICPSDLEWCACTCDFPTIDIRAKHDATHRTVFPNGRPPWEDVTHLDLTQDDE
jgi:hypothetical protein